MKAILSFIFFTVLLNLSFGQVQEAINSFSKDSKLEHASISFYAYDLTSKKTISDFNGKTSLPTASTAKLYPTAIALEMLGKDFRPETRIYINGRIENGVLKGDLIVRGGGDVTLGSRFFNDAGHEKDFLKQWLDSIKEAGITKIEGNVICDGSDFGYMGIPDGWSWGDQGNYYGAGVSGISVYDNTLFYQFKTSSKAGDTAQLISIFPNYPELSFRNEITASTKGGDNSYIYGSPFSKNRFGVGTLPVNSSRFQVKGSHPDPEHQLSLDLHQFLIENGIQIAGAPQSYLKSSLQTISYKDDQMLFSYFGRTVEEIATITNMKSVNLFAEGLLCLVGYHFSGKGTTEEGLKQIELFLESKKISQHGFYLNDGSGLSRSNGISAWHFCHLLEFMYHSKSYSVFEKTLPVAGKSGTLSSLCSGQTGQGRIFAKSGTMHRIKSYSGYVKTKSGKMVAFAFIVNNYSCSSSELTKKMEVVLNAMAGL
ncbi:MAG: D-alanyl-D-alanine carboxypeptidase/D-alanyl-D-alanine-endopeptidase [Bacteroidetes bacterium]|nr:MAG: D-alanyl-D-alanine carboxypeptidase/D-alanyl-D-alanine-endopeptidase [Bacteroidota bacterium]